VSLVKHRLLVRGNASPADLQWTLGLLSTTFYRGFIADSSPTDRV
jgi:hypothetical protein